MLDDCRQADLIKYPVICLQNGSADENFIYILGVVQYLNFPWINMLPKSIVAGIANVDRRGDFTFPTALKKIKKIFLPQVNPDNLHSS